MEEHVLCAVVLVVVAVDAVIVLLFVGTVVLIDGVNIPVCEVALVEAQLAVQLVSGFNQTIAQVGVNRLFRHMEVVILELYPSRWTVAIDANRNLLSLAGGKQVAPLSGVYHDFAVFSSACQ